jgi:iron(III) transport system permease protein
VRPPLNVIPIYGTLVVIILGLTTSYLAFGARLMNGAVIQLHKDLEEAAQVSGAGQSLTLLRITLPLVFPAFLNGWLWVAAHSMRSFGIPLVLRTDQNEMFGVRLWRFWSEGYPGLATATGVLFLITVALVALVARLLMVRLGATQRTEEAT